MAAVIYFIYEKISKKTSLFIDIHVDISSARSSLTEHNQNQYICSDKIQELVEKHNQYSYTDNEYVYTCFITEYNSGCGIMFADYDICKCREMFKQNIFSNDDYKSAIELYIDDYFKINLGDKKIYKVIQNTKKYNEPSTVILLCREYYSGDEVQMEFDHKKMISCLNCE